MSQGHPVTLPAAGYPGGFLSPSMSMSGMSAAVGQYSAYAPLADPHHSHSHAHAHAHAQTHPHHSHSHSQHTHSHSHSHSHTPSDLSASAGTNLQVLSLPPIRSDGRVPVGPAAGSAASQSSQAPQQHQQAPPPPPPPPPPSGPPGQMPPPMPQYYINPVQQYPMATADPNQPMRYPIPPADSRIMSGPRHKKEIKRRTKTGCLTCRKRRIKCDEQHPACRNCQKSKRECLGYDPIFKPQPGPAAIQPALGSTPTSISHNPTAAAPYPPTYASTYPGYSSLPSTGEASGANPHEYSAAIDPALAGAMAHSLDGAGDPIGHRAKRVKIDDLFTPHNTPFPPLPVQPSPIPETVMKDMLQIWNTIYAPGIDKFLETKWFVSHGERYLVANHALCNQFVFLMQRFTLDMSEHNSQQNFNITMGLETATIWALMNLCRQPLPSSSADGDAATPSDVKPPYPKFTDDDFKSGVLRASKRLEIVEALITGEGLPADPTNLAFTADQATSTDEVKSNNTTPFEDQLKGRELAFWKCLHTFLSASTASSSSSRPLPSSSSASNNNDTSPVDTDSASAAAAATKEVDDAVTSCRSFLDSRENRDVLYSIMVARHIGAKLAEQYLQAKNKDAANASAPGATPVMPTSNDEADNRNKVYVAKKFIEDEAAGKGTNQVVQRLCAMVARSWRR